MSEQSEDYWRNVVRNTKPFCLYQCKFCAGTFTNAMKPYESFIHTKDCPWLLAQDGEA